MKIHELTELLKNFPADMEVIVQSYEEGFDPVTDVKPITVAKSHNKQWYTGVFDESTSPASNAVIIYSRHNRADDVDGVIDGE